MLAQPPSEPPIPHDQPMIGKCLSCGTTVTCKFGDCKVIDDPPLGRVATVACPNVLHEMTTFDKTKQAGPVVRMRRQKRGGA